MRADVSVNTVSRALNDRPDISDETKARIRAIADELGYTRNLVAKGLATKQNPVIGVVVSDNVNPYFAEVIRGISFVAQSKQWTIFLVNTYVSRSTEREAITTLAQHRVGGLIIFPLDGEQVDEYVRFGLPMVVAGARLPGTKKRDFDVVAPDDYNGAKEAVEHLVRSGRKRIVYCGPHEFSLSGEPRWRGYVDVMKEAGLEPVTRAIPEVSAFEGYRHGLSWPDLDQVDAIFAFNDLMAFGLSRALGERGVGIPDDIALIGYDDVEFSRFTTPALTTVRIPKENLGQQAATLLIQRIEGDFREPSIERILPTELIIRETA